MREHAIEEHGSAGSDRNGGCLRYIQKFGIDLAVASMVVLESSFTVTARDHMHAAVLRTCVIQRDPNTEDRVQRLHREISIVLMQRLHRANKRRVNKRQHCENDRRSTVQT